MDDAQIKEPKSHGLQADLKAAQQLVLVLTTVAEENDATRIARELVMRKLAACVSQTQIRSTFVWQGSLESSAEIQLTIKTTQQRAEEVLVWLRLNHPYDNPEMLLFPVAVGSVAYGQWVRDQTTSSEN